MRRALLAALCLLAGAAPASAQAVDFLTHTNLKLAAEHLSSDDPRYTWDTSFGGDIDFVDYGKGRVNFAASYQAILGEEIRHFDPNQGNYYLTGLVSWRAGGLEVGGVFHHESRHLGDRAKQVPVDWNMVGARLLAHPAYGRHQTDVQVDLRGTILRSYVDYTWEADSQVRHSYRVSSRALAFGGGDVRLLGTNGTRDRGTQAGLRAEGGVRLEGKGAAVELFVATERRVDPYPLAFGTERWVSAGFRLLSR